MYWKRYARRSAKTLKRRILTTLGVCVLISAGVAFAAPPESGGYLAGYENADPQPSAFSLWSTLAYLLSLLVVFVFVAGAAYLAACFLGGRFNQDIGGGGRLLSSVALGPKMSVCVVELAGKVMLLGVTEQNVNLLGEIDDLEEIERLHRQSFAAGLNGTMFSREFGALSGLVQKIPPFFRNDK